jgi:hypothetical protein
MAPRAPRASYRAESAHTAIRADAQFPHLGQPHGSRLATRNIGLLLTILLALLAAPTWSQTPPETAVPSSDPADISSFGLKRGIPIWLPPPLAAQLPPSFIDSEDDRVTKAVSSDSDLVDTLIALASSGVYEFVTLEFKDHTAAEYRVIVADPGPGKTPRMKLVWSGIAFKRMNNGVDVRITRRGNALFLPPPG